MKSVISMIAFTLAFGFSVVLVGLIFGFPQVEKKAEVFQIRSSHSRCLNQTQRNIQSLLRQDISNGQERLSNPDGISKYVDSSESINDANVPADFRKEWRSHMKAWRAYSDFLQKTARSSEKMSESEFAQLEREYDAEISRTWYNVLDSAENHYPGIRIKLGQ